MNHKKLSQSIGHKEANFTQFTSLPLKLFFISHLLLGCGYINVLGHSTIIRGGIFVLFPWRDRKHKKEGLKKGTFTVRTYPTTFLPNKLGIRINLRKL